MNEGARHTNESRYRLTQEKQLDEIKRLLREMLDELIFLREDFETQFPLSVASPTPADAPPVSSVSRDDDDE